MNDNDYIRAGVGLADEWEYLQSPQPTIRTPDRAYYYLCGGKYAQEVLDSLAAQLVSQVDAMDTHCFASDIEGVAMVWQIDWPQKELQINHGTRTMNTIRVIIDSEVLK